MFTLINWLLHSIFTPGTNHSKDYNQWLGIMHHIQSEGEFRNWRESLSNGWWADEKILGEVQFMGQSGPCSPLLTQFHPHLTDTSLSQTNDNKNIHMHTQTLTIGFMGTYSKKGINMKHPPFHGGGRQCSSFSWWIPLSLHQFPHILTWHIKPTSATLRSVAFQLIKI